ncbi:SRPBCC family protein [Gordonia crocea]|uniref:Polyketide cyclase n=1 Tax=Gordonia crocea TaxID=589162 RepID=A0A7M3SUH0_9ACTN|nr:SRPBCC family protein [Gordonia crocea]GED96294.1 hypothetical protein nbrc107697_03330 [Gordonia crocea]
MITMERTVTTAASPDAVFAYLSDFTTAAQWDPNAVEVVRTTGDGGVGTVYRVTSKFAGRTTELDYCVVDLEQTSLIRLVGEKKSITAVDTITIGSDDAGTHVTYAVEFSFHGPLRLAEPLLKFAVADLFKSGAIGLSEALDRPTV